MSSVLVLAQDGRTAPLRTLHTAAIIEKARRLREGVNVPRPAQALILRWTIGRDFEKVLTHAPDDVLVEPADHVVGAREQACALHVHVPHLASTSFGADTGGQLSHSA